MVGGAILLSKQDENGEQKWTTGMTTEGISASLVTAGTVNTGTINIMRGDEPAFRWDALGISAFNDTDTTKFVRFDKHGIYGIDDESIDGKIWSPIGGSEQTPLEEIGEKAVFALTWEGLKVTGDENVVARIGKQDKYIMTV
jgi:hypothetical protein